MSPGVTHVPGRDEGPAWDRPFVENRISGGQSRVMASLTLSTALPAFSLMEPPT
jgi:hypothetical protein